MYTDYRGMGYTWLLKDVLTWNPIREEGEVVQYYVIMVHYYNDFDNKTAF